MPKSHALAERMRLSNMTLNIQLGTHSTGKRGSFGLKIRNLSEILYLLYFSGVFPIISTRKELSHSLEHLNQSLMENQRLVLFVFILTFTF